MKKIFTYALLTLLGLILVSPHAFAASEPTEGYDENTEIVITGVVGEVIEGKAPDSFFQRRFFRKAQRHGPVVITLQGTVRSYAVVTAPQWYLVKHDISFEPGTELEVKGAKFFGREGTLFVISREIKFVSTGRIVELRDRFGMPLWKRGGMQGRTPP